MFSPTAFLKGLSAHKKRYKFSTSALKTSLPHNLVERRHNTPSPSTGINIEALVNLIWTYTNLMISMIMTPSSGRTDTSHRFGTRTHHWKNLWHRKNWASQLECWFTLPRASRSMMQKSKYRASALFARKPGVAFHSRLWKGSKWSTW